MADAKVSALTALGAAPATGDLFPIVDISDTTDAATGTTKKLTVAELFTSPTLTTSITTDYLTASEIIISDGSKKIVSAPVATYPSLTELTYLKGVTSAIQTQFTAKAPLVSPSFTTPVLGVATATSVNGLTISTTTGTFTLTNGKTLAVTNTITLSGTDSTVMTFPSTSQTIAGLTSTQTLTNKRITKRVVTTTDDATAVIDVDVTDVYELSAVANATTFTLTGTPTDGQTFIVRYKDAGVAKALTWTGFTAIGVTLPTTTTASKWGYVGVQYNSAASAYHVLAVTTEA